MTKKYLYDDYVRTLSQRFAAKLDEIQAEHGFEYGQEFEIAICQILRAALPNKYGICRGYVVDADGNKAGDDIIIFAQDRFPTLRLHPADDYSRKQNIPIEAVYAYIEAKHSLVVKGTKGASLDKACRQVAAVKELVSKRKARPIVNADAYVNLQVPIVQEGSYSLAAIRNPVYGVVLSRYVKETDDGNALQPDQIATAFKTKTPDGNTIFPDILMTVFPDLIVAGDGVVVVPAAIRGDRTEPTIFTGPGITSVAVERIDDVAFGAAFCSLFFALDWIELGSMPFPLILGDAFNLKIHS